MSRMKINPLEPPCTKDCPNRLVGCHSMCGAYLSYRRAADDAKKELNNKLDEIEYFHARHKKFADSEALRKKRGRK